MANRRYEEFLDREPRARSWFDDNAPGLVVDDPTNPAIEQGGIVGRPTTVPANQIPVTPPNLGNLRPDLPSRGGSPATAVGGPEQFGGDYEQWFRALVGNRPWNQATLTNLMPVLSQYGIKLTPPNAAGEQTKIQLPNGQW